MFDKKTQRIILIIIAVILIVTMVGSLFVAAFADELPSDQKVEASEEADASETARAMFISPFSEEEDTILTGIKVGSVDVSGLTLEEAKKKVYEHVDELQSQTLTVNANGQTNSIEAGDLGFSWNNPDSINGAPLVGKSGNVIERYKVYKDCANEGYIYPVQYDVSEEAVRSFVAQTANIADVSVKEPGITMTDDGTLEVVDGQNGQALNQEDAVNTILNVLRNEWEKGSTSLDFAMETTEPSVSNETMHSVDAILGSGETDFAGSLEGRIQNLHNAVSKVNGTVIMPGQQLSLTSLLVPFDEDNGYALAHSYSEGSTVDTYGGGVCQVSTTLYLAVLNAELQVDERHPHSMLVDYAELSKDAAIAEGVKDFKFTNNTDAPVYIRGTIEGTKIRFDIYGHETRDPNRTVEYRSETLEMQEATTNIILNDGAKFGYILQTNGGHTGAKSRMTKIVTENGQTTEEEINEDEYSMQPIVYEIGTQGATASQIAAVSAETSGGDIHEVISAINANGGNAKVIMVFNGETVPEE